MSKPQVVILAGGSNSRFFPLNTTVHKGAIRLMGETFIGRTLNSLRDHGYTDMVIVESPRDQDSGSLKSVVDQISAGLKIDFITQTEAKGMGNALLTAKSHLTDQFLVIFPDLINAGELADRLLDLGSSAAICTTDTTEPWLYGIVEMQDGLAKNIEEKPVPGQEKSNQKILGVYLLDQKYLSLLQALPEAEYNFEQALSQLFQAEPVKVLKLDVPILSLKYPWHLFEFQQLLFGQLQLGIDPAVQIAKTAIIDDAAGPVVISKGAKIGDFAKIVGPVFIGPNCLVGDYSFVRGSSLEAGSVVGANTEVVRSIIGENSTLHFGYLADSILGPNNQIGAGLITANKRLDRATIKTMVKGILTDTGLGALGIITGESAKLGIRTSTMPGVLIGADTQIHPGLTISKNLDHGATQQKT